MHALSYRPEIDGLRALAVVPVILFHLGIPQVPGGFLGVDVFFVVSGFLITSIIQAELAAGVFTFRGFYARRIRRIMPALLIVLATTMVAGWLFLSRVEYPVLGRDALATLLGTGNISFFVHGNEYWGGDAKNLLLLHMWSLSVEEQFYVVFPLILWCFARFRWPGLRFLLAGLILVSFLLFLIGSRKAPDATFYLLPTRVWELATGALLAVMGRNATHPPTRPFLNASLGLIGLIMICVTYSLAVRFGGRTAPAVLGTAMVIRFAQTGAAHTLLSQSSVVHLGKLSYSLYLWHWPLLVFFKKLDWMVPGVLVIGLAYLLALATYYLIEQPCRKKGQSLIAIGLAYLTTLGLAWSLAGSNGIYDSSEFEKPVWPGAYYSVQPTPFIPENLPENAQRLIAGLAVPKPSYPPNAYKNGGVIVGEGDSPPRIVVLGDSHGCMWSGAIRSVTDQQKIKTSFWSIGAVDPFTDIPVTFKPGSKALTSQQRFEYDQSRLDLIREWHPDLVIFCALWRGKQPAQFHELLSYLAKHCGQVLIMEQPPEMAIGSQSLLQHLCYKQIRPIEGMKRYLPQGRALDSQYAQKWLKELASQYPNCTMIPTFDLYLQGSEVLCLDGRNPVFMDGNHLTDFGTRIAIPRLEQAISRALEIKPATRPHERPQGTLE